MNPFLAPKTNYTNFYDEARFQLTWKLNTFMFFVNVPLVFTAAFFPLEEFLAVLFGWLVPVVYLIILFVTRKFKVLAIVYVILGTLSTGGLMNVVATNFHIIEIVFMVMISLYAFITLGRAVGIASIIGHCAWVIYYFFFGLNADILRTDTLSLTEQIWSTANFLVAFSMVAYLIVEFIKVNKHVEEKYVSSNLELIKTNNVVELRDKEKTVLLQEIHHRVKNNLQIITSLLRLQSNDVTDEKSKQQFNDAINRVIAMSMIHEKMYQTQNFSSLNLEEYLTTLSSDLITSYSMEKPVSVTIKSSVESIGAKAIVPLSLIFNELITNSLKHAFRDSEKGTIEIKIKPLENRRFEVYYSDNGKWKENRSQQTFGTELITILTEQMSGEHSKQIDTTGTHYTFILTNPN